MASTQNIKTSGRKAGKWRVAWRWFGIAAIGALIIGFAGFLTIVAFPPFEWSTPASDILSAADTTNEAIDATLEKDRDMSANIRRLMAGENSICKSGQPKSVEGLKSCLGQIVQRTERENASLDKVLVASQSKLHSAKKSLQKASEASDNRVFAFFDQFKRLLKWLGPAAVGTVVAALLIAVALLRPEFWTYFKGNASFKLPFGAEINLTNMQSLRQNVSDRFAALDADISLVYRQRLADQNFDALFAGVKAQIDAAFRPRADLRITKHRATLFVPGFVGEELVQATTYFGHEFSAGGGVVGRRFSARYGIIGKSWRMQHSLYNAYVTNDKQALVRLWGFTRSEAANVHAGEAALVAFAIRPDRDLDPLGIIYFEGYAANAFGTPAAGAVNEDGLEPGDLEMEKLWVGLAEKNDVKALIEALRVLRQELNWDSKVVQKAVG